MSQRLTSSQILRGFEIDHATLNRWVLHFAPLLEQASRKYKRPADRSWRMDETYIKIKGKWRYLYRAVDKYGATVDFMGPNVIFPPPSAI